MRLDGSDEGTAAANAAVGTLESTADRRLLDAPPAERLIRDSLAQKVLHGWLQNRHQTLMPLNVNLGRLSTGERAAIARLAALAIQACPEASSSSMRSWLISVGADEGALEAFDAAEPSALPLVDVLAAVERPDVAMTAFVVALVGARETGSVGEAFAGYVAARLSLPTTAVRSARRRYGS